jgi:hypothetical protein
MGRPVAGDRTSWLRLQFCRYAPPVARCGRRVVLEARPVLRRPPAGTAGVDQVAAQGAALAERDLNDHGVLLAEEGVR